MSAKVKVVIAKLGLDIHWRGAVMVSKFLRDNGMEVVYLGNCFPKDIVDAALDEGADVIGLSTLCGNHLTLGPKVVEILKERGVTDVPVFIGGTIPPDDIPRLKDAGMSEVFPPETPLDDILSIVSQIIRRKQVEKGLDLSEKRFRKLTSMSPVGIYESDTFGKYIYVNQRWSQTTGVSEHDAIGENCLSGVYEYDQQRVESAWTKLLVESRSLS